MNYNYKLGLRTSAILLGGLGLGYNAYDAIFNKCQCNNPLGNNYKKPDVFGQCPCGTEVGSRRILDPTGVKNNETVDPKKLQQVPDSMQFLDTEQRNGIQLIIITGKTKISHKENYHRMILKRGVLQNQIL
jgi:hypothetical protein